MTAATLPQATYVDNILSVWNARTYDQERDGREWYVAMARIMREHAIKSGLTVAQCAAIYAATSINTSWSINLSLAARSIEDRGLYGGTLGMVCDKVNAIIDHGYVSDATIDGILSADPKRMKLRNFWRNLAGDHTAVTVDRWARRIATGDYASKSVPNGAEYDAIASAYRTVAAMVGETPATVQAVTWCVARGDGE